MSGLWRADLRTKDGHLSERLVGSRTEAERHFRDLLGRKALDGQPIAARLVSPIARKAIYFSWFDRAYGAGRIHPDAPLDLDRLDDGTAEAAAWTPSGPDPRAELQRLLEAIRDREARVVLPWTHEIAADEYARMLDHDRRAARKALQLLERIPRP